MAEKLGVDYDYTDGDDGRRADLAWLQRVTDLHLGAVLHWTGLDPIEGWQWGNHAVTFLGFDAEGDAWILDNNHPAHYQRLPRERFTFLWQHSGGDGFTFTFHLSPEE